MAIFVKDVKPTLEALIKIRIRTPVIIRKIRTKIELFANILCVIGYLQLLLGIYGMGCHVFRYGKGAPYHQFLHCRNEIKIGAYFEYIMEAILAIFLLVTLDDPTNTFRFTRYWLNSCWFMMAFSSITLSCAIQHGMPSDLVLSGVIWFLLHFVQMCFGTIFCTLLQQEKTMMNLPIFIRQKRTKRIKKEKLEPIPEETV